ncbi:CDC45-like protein [Ramicandelaber brevisporus]|nr:CDC45-like protein [Ramicandelaber brevisporus]
MFLTTRQLGIAYDKIRQSAAGTTCSVVICAAADPDSLCALRILASLLRDDFISYRIVPVSGYADLDSINEELKQQAESGEGGIRSVITINCGGSIDLGQYFTLPSNVIMYVVDSHRPFNLYNLYANDQVVVLDDGDIEEEMMDVRQAFERLETELTDNEEDENDVDNDKDDDIDSDDDNDQIALDDDDDDDYSDNDDNDTDNENEDEGEDENENEDDAEEMTRRHREIEKHQRIKERDSLKERIAQYYLQGSFHGQPSSVAMLMMAKRLGKPRNSDQLWMAITGLTYHYVYDHLDALAYEEQVTEFKNELEIMENSSNTSQLHQHHQLHQQLQQSNAQTAQSRNQIKFNTEYKFVLYRHWSLYESIYHSPHVASKLMVWTDKGRDTLDLNLTKIGFSHQEAKQPFVNVTPELRQMLSNKLTMKNHSLDLHPCFHSGLSYSSFVRGYGWTKGCSEMSASDMVYSTIALLNGAASNSNSVEWRNSDGSIGTVGGNDDGNAWLRGFYTAYDSLSDHGMLLSGVSFAIQLQSALIRSAKFLIDRKAVRTLSTFRLIVISDAQGLSSATAVTASQSSNRSLSQRPNGAHNGSSATTSIVGAMASLSSETDANIGRNQSVLPFVMAMLVDKDRDIYLVIPLPGSAYAGNRRNHFGTAFLNAAQKIDAQTRHNAFDMSVMEIRGAELQNFITALRKELTIAKNNSAAAAAAMSQSSQRS